MLKELAEKKRFTELLRNAVARLHFEVFAFTPEKAMMFSYFSRWRVPSRHILVLFRSNLFPTVFKDKKRAGFLGFENLLLSIGGKFLYGNSKRYILEITAIIELF